MRTFTNFRKWNKFRAWAGGYFWIPCPLCDEYFGGHEVPTHFGNSIIIGENMNHKVVCKNCCEKTYAYNIEICERESIPYRVAEETTTGQKAVIIG